MCNKSLPGSARRSRTKHAPRKKCCDADQCSIFACTYIFSPGNRNGLSSCTVRKTTSEPPVFYIRASRARDKMTKSHGACDGRDPSRRKLILMDNSGQQGNNLNGNRKRGKVFAGSGSDSTKLCTNLIHAIPKLTIAPWVSSIPASCSCLSQWHTLAHFIHLQVEIFAKIGMLRLHLLTSSYICIILTHPRSNSFSFRCAGRVAKMSIQEISRRSAPREKKAREKGVEGYGSEIDNVPQHANGEAKQISG